MLTVRSQEYMSTADEYLESNRRFLGCTVTFETLSCNLSHKCGCLRTTSAHDNTMTFANEASP